MVIIVYDYTSELILAWTCKGADAKTKRFKQRQIMT